MKIYSLVWPFYFYPQSITMNECEPSFEASPKQAVWIDLDFLTGTVRSKWNVLKSGTSPSLSAQVDFAFLKMAPHQVCSSDFYTHGQPLTWLWLMYFAHLILSIIAIYIASHQIGKWTILLPEILSSVDSSGNYKHGFLVETHSLKTNKKETTWAYNSGYVC